MVGLIARKYAKALFELSLEANAVDAYMAAAKDILPLFDADGEFYKIIANPSVLSDEKVAFFKDVASKAVENLPEDFTALMALLTRKGREAESAGVFEGFVELAREYKRITTARVFSAKPLDDGRLSDIKERLEKKLNKTVEIDAVIDESLIAGLKISVDGMEIDGTVRRGIDSLRAAIYA